VLLPALEFGERIEMWISITQADDETDVHPFVGSVIDEAAAVGARTERPAERVHDLTGPMLRGGDLPNFFEPQPEMLRVRICTQTVARLEIPA
jgi:hypothetical protein